MLSYVGSEVGEVPRPVRATGKGAHRRALAGMLPQVALERPAVRGRVVALLALVRLVVCVALGVVPRDLHAAPKNT